MEFFASGDYKEAAIAVTDLRSPLFLHEFVKRLLGSSLDHSVREHDLAIQLLSQMHKANVLPAEMVQLGFYRLVEALDDLSIDVPKVSPIVGKFVLRAVADGMLKTEFVETIPVSSESSSEMHNRTTSELAQFRQTIYNMYQAALWTVDIGSEGQTDEAVPLPLSPRGICIAAAAANTESSSASSPRSPRGARSRPSSPRSPTGEPVHPPLSPRTKLRIEVQRKKQEPEMISMDEIRQAVASELAPPVPSWQPADMSKEPNQAAATAMCQDLRQSCDKLNETTDVSERQIDQIKNRSPQKLDNNRDEVMDSLQSMYELSDRFQRVDNRIIVDYAPF